MANINHLLNNYPQELIHNPQHYIYCKQAYPRRNRNVPEFISGSADLESSPPVHANPLTLHGAPRRCPVPRHLFQRTKPNLEPRFALQNTSPPKSGTERRGCTLCGSDIYMYRVRDRSDFVTPWLLLHADILYLESMNNRIYTKKIDPKPHGCEYPSISADGVIPVAGPGYPHGLVSFPDPIYTFESVSSAMIYHPYVMIYSWVGI